MNYFSYFSEIEETFIRRRGRNLLLSPLDWALIESWQEREVPLHVILRAINTVFDAAEKNPQARRPIKRLLYCKDEIEQQFAAWSAMQTGKNSAPRENSAVKENEDKMISENSMFPPETIDAHLQTAADALERAAGDENSALFDLLKETSEYLKKLRNASVAVEELEAGLERADRLIDENLRRAANENELKRIVAAVEKKLAAHRATMDDAVYRRTVDLMLLKQLREQAKIPRLSLFYL